MADLRYTVDIDTRGARQSLNSLTSSLGGIAAAIGTAFGTREIVQTIARFEDLRTTLKFLFRETGDGAKAFEQIKAFAASSIFSVEDLTASVVKLKAAGLDPTIKQLTLFADVAAVSTDSLGVLQAMTDLFARTTEGGLGLEDLNRLADRGVPVFKILGETLGLSRLEIAKFGQSAEGAQTILKALTAGLEDTFGGAQAERAGNLSQAFSNLQDALQGMADALGQGGLSSSLNEVIRGFSQFVQDNEKLIGAVGAGLGGAIKFVADNAKLLGVILGSIIAGKVIAQVLSLASAFLSVAKALKSTATAGAVLQGVTGVGLIKLTAGLAAVAGVLEGIEQYTTQNSDSVEGLNDQIDKLKENAGSPIQIPEGPLTANVPEDAFSSYKEDMEKIKNKQDDLTRSAINYFAQYKDNVNDTLRKVREETKLVGVTEQQATVQRELQRFQQQYYDTIRPLQEQLTKLRKEDTDEAKVQAAEIEKQLAQIQQFYAIQSTELQKELQLREKLKQEEEARLLFLNNRRDLEQNLADMVRDSNNAIKDLSLGDFDQEIEGIRRQVDDKLVASIRNVKSAWENGLITGDQYIAEIKVLEEEATKAFEKLTENAQKQREIQRSFEYGWRRAFESFKDDATNAAKTAEKIFTQVTDGIEDRIVDFVKTGKLEFKSLVADILETILRSQIQQIIAKTFGAFGGAGGGSSALGGLFSGFFANGGMIPAGSFGVVGERGPELVSGPAQVTPLTGGGNVTYNINAVDAMSFKQMVARDPGFIHAVASQGARKVPSRR